MFNISQHGQHNGHSSPSTFRRTTAPGEWGEGQQFQTFSNYFPNIVSAARTVRCHLLRGLGMPRTEKADSRNTAGQNSQSDPNGSSGCLHNEIRREPQSCWEECAQNSRLPVTREQSMANRNPWKTTNKHRTPAETQGPCPGLKKSCVKSSPCRVRLPKWCGRLGGHIPHQNVFVFCSRPTEVRAASM